MAASHTESCSFTCDHRALNRFLQLTAMRVIRQRSLLRRSCQKPLFRGDRHQSVGYGLDSRRLRRPHRRAASARIPRAALAEFLTVSHAAAAGAGLLLALVSTRVLSSKDSKDLEEERERSASQQQRLDELERSLENLHAESETDRQRVRVLEKARAAAVMDVTHALSQKRDAEFALSEARQEIDRLTSNTAKHMDGEERESVSVDSLPKAVSDQLTPEAQKLLKEWLNAVQKDKEIDSHGLTNADLALQELKSALTKEEERRKAAETELKTVRDFAQFELQSMTADLIKGRDENTGLKENISKLEGEAASLRSQLTESQTLVEDLSAQISLFHMTSAHSAGSSPATDRYAHTMRAEAAHMVETIEDKAHANVQKALQKSQTAQQAALREFTKAMRAKDREEKLKATLEKAENRIREQTVQVNYLKELIQILSSKEMQEAAEEQTIRQHFPPEE